MKFTAYALLLSCGLLAVPACSTSTPPQADGMSAADCSTCTENQMCSEGTCVDLPTTCPCPVGEFCDPASNRCLPGCRSAWDCPSSADPCRVTACHAGACTFDAAPDGHECAPRDACSRSFCEAGQCVVRAYNEGDPCPDDGNPCTSDLCAAARCTHPALPDQYSGTCPDDGNPCTSDVCIAARCAHPTAPDYTFCGSGTGDGRFKQCLAGVCTWDKAFCSRGLVGCSCGQDTTGMGNYTLSSWISCFCSGKDLVLPVALGMTRLITCPNACNTYPPDLMTCL